MEDDNCEIEIIRKEILNTIGLKDAYQFHVGFDIQRTTDIKVQLFSAYILS